MLYSLRGKLLQKDAGWFAVECGGVGYKCLATMNTLSRLPVSGEEVFVYTHLKTQWICSDFTKSERLTAFAS